MIAALGWRLFFLFTGLSGLVWLVAWLFSIRLWKHEPGGEAPGNVNSKFSLRESLPLLRNRRIVGIFLGFFAYDYAWFLLLRWMPVYLTVERHFDLRSMALANSIPFAVVVLLTVPAGIVGDLFVRKGWNEITVRKAHS